MERIFGVLKKRFKCIRTIPEYSLHHQTLIVYAITAIHNVIHEYKDASEENNMWEITEDQDLSSISRGLNTNDGDTLGSEKQYYVGSPAINQKRDKIVEDMWTQYQEYIRMEANTDDDT